MSIHVLFFGSLFGYSLMPFLISMPEDVDIFNPRAPKLSEERANYLRRFIPKDKNTTMHIYQVINPFTLFILRQCTLYLVYWIFNSSRWKSSMALLCYF